jgi:hypothetical protein
MIRDLAPHSAKLVYRSDSPSRADILLSSIIGAYIRSSGSRRSGKSVNSTVLVAVLVFVLSILNLLWLFIK